MDKIFRSKLYDHESSLPDDLWNKIENGISKKKKRGFIWFLFGGIGLLGLISSSLYFSGFPFEKEDNFITDSIEVSIQDNDIAINSPISNIDNEKKIENKQILPKTTSVPINNQYRKTYLSPLEEKENEKLVSITKIEREAKVIEISKNQEIDIPRININYPDLLTSRSFKDPIGCPSFSNKSKANLFVEAYYQPLFAYSIVSSNSAEVGDQYIQLRKDSEQNLYSWSAGANIGWLSDYNVGVKAGAEYEVINERFTYEDPEAIRNQTVITIDTVFNNDGTFNVSMDTSVVQISGAELQKIHNYHKTLSIPIHAIYQMNFKNLGVELSGGPIFNVHYQNRGKIIDPSNEDRWFTKGESGSYDVYRNRLSVSFSLSVSALYSINENIQLFARPTFKFSPGTISVTTSPFNQTYTNTGLAIGARYYISGNPNY